jgi:hypothetical protein
MIQIIQMPGDWVGKDVFVSIKAKFLLMDLMGRSLYGIKAMCQAADWPYQILVFENMNLLIY